MRFILGLSIVLLLSSCASTTGNYYTESVSTWRGGHVNSLIQRWGMPYSKVTYPEGNTVYLYKTESYRAYNSTPSPLIGVNFTPGGEPVIITQQNPNPTGTRGLTLDCVTVFVVNKAGVITNTKTKGAGCYGGIRNVGK